VLSLSAFRDPLSGAPLHFSAAQRAALNDPDLRAAESRDAYRAQAADPLYGGAAWAQKHGIDVEAAPVAAAQR
jgi:cytochrome c oxidase cbb3-type subunit 2